MAERKLGKIIFRYILQWKETVCIVMSIRQSVYLKVCALDAKGKMNNVQAWIAKGLGQRRLMSARLWEGWGAHPSPRRAATTVCLMFLWSVAHLSVIVHCFWTLIRCPGFWAPTSIRELRHTLLRGDKIEIAFKIRKLGVNEPGALSLKCIFILISKCHICFFIHRRHRKPKPHLC